MGYQVKLNVFEGPFDLLVYLIESARMNIYDIRVSEITSQYLDYLDRMQQMDVKVSSEFMVLAAELIALKSKMLLPRRLPEEHDASEEDPRTGLVERILEYRKYKALSEMLADREEHSRAYREKPQEDVSSFSHAPEEILTTDWNQFVRAFRAFLHRRKKLNEIQRRYERMEQKKITAERRREDIRALLDADPGTPRDFTELVGHPEDPFDVALSFSAMLEMIKERQITADQRRRYGPIAVRAVIPADSETDQKEKQKGTGDANKSCGEIRV